MNPEVCLRDMVMRAWVPVKVVQAEFVLAPHADFNCLKSPNVPGDQWDFLLLSDVFPTAFHTVQSAPKKRRSNLCFFIAL